jgi:dipeptidyl aminopeptidase/acylaminoacyl peptidase
MNLRKQLGCPVHRGLIAMSGIATLLLSTASAQDSKPFTLQQVMSAPYANNLTAAPVGNLFGWVEDAEGRHNLWVGGKDMPARQLTHNTEDDGQDITRLAWSPDATAIAYTYGASNGADGKPANPAHLQRPTPVQVIVQPLAADAKPIVIGDGRNPLYARDGKSLYYLRDGQIWIACLMSCHPEQAQRAEGPDTKSVPRAHQMVFDRGSASSLTLSPDGNTLAFISRRREANEPSHSLLALYNLQTHTLTFPAASTGDDSAPAFSPDGKQLAWLRAPFTDTPEFALNRTSANPWSIQLLDLATNTTRTAYSPEPNKPGSVLPIPDDEAPYLLWTADNHIIFLSEASGWDHLYLVDPATKAAPILLTGGDGEVEGASLSDDRTELFWASNIPMTEHSYAGLADCMGPVLELEMADIERRHISRLDIAKPPTPPSGKPNPINDALTADFARETSGQGIETHPVALADGSVVALASDSFTPMHPVYLAKNDGSTSDAREQWLSNLYPRDALVFPEEVSFPYFGGSSAGRVKASTPARDRPMLHAQLFRPGNTKAKGNDLLPWCNGHNIGSPAKTPDRRPAIIFMHGGPRRQMLLGYPAMEYYSNAYAMNQYLTSRGFIVLSVNYRCGIGYGLDFRQCDHEGATGAAEYNDILAAQRYLAARPDVDAKRIGLWGGSYGGYLTALGLARNSDLFAAGVDFHGVHDWNLEDNAADWKRGNNAEQDAIASKALQSSPLADLSKWRSPILLIHGDNDPSVAYAQTPLLAEALRARNTHLPAAQQVDVEELIFPDEVHEFLLRKDWLAAYTAAAAFFERVLKP